mmetsp:Transcript_11318/g.31521  ORF Transcript_11318/g.31521 Transcript_11318/m.31521 type:complete len:316 (-) Transcript_11318:4-951(-)
MTRQRILGGGGLSSFTLNFIPSPTVLQHNELLRPLVLELRDLLHPLQERGALLLGLEPLLEVGDQLRAEHLPPRLEVHLDFSLGRHARRASSGSSLLLLRRRRRRPRGLHLDLLGRGWLRPAGRGAVALLRGDRPLLLIPLGLRGVHDVGHVLGLVARGFVGGLPPQVGQVDALELLLGQLVVVQPLLLLPAALQALRVVVEPDLAQGLLHLPLLLRDLLDFAVAALPPRLQVHLQVPQVPPPRVVQALLLHLLGLDLLLHLALLLHRVVPLRLQVGVVHLHPLVVVVVSVLVLPVLPDGGLVLLVPLLPPPPIF